LTKSWLVVETRASFTMTTGSNLEEERTVHSVHLNNSDTNPSN